MGVIVEVPDALPMLQTVMPRSRICFGEGVSWRLYGQLGLIDKLGS